MKRIIFTIICIGILAATAGCNTVRGVGKDIERAGEGLQNATN